GFQTRQSEFRALQAPTRGTILKKLAEGSELVGPGTPIVLFGTQDQAKVVKVFVADKEVVHLGLGDPATLSFDAYPGKKFTGKVSEVASFADPYTGTYEVEISLDAAPQKLLSGFIASVEIAGQESQDLLKIPVDALLVANGIEGTVYVHQNGKALKRSIQIYKLAQDHILVNGGLQAGEEVIVRGAGYLSDQEPVLVQK
ncbi:MAG: efflux RND transporter periplasmic adaptor subunit, partial [Bacteroidota bacterium]